MLKNLILACLLLAFATPSYAEDFDAPSWPELVRTMARFKAFDPGDDRVMDDYGVVTECKMYLAFYRDDFKWNKVRGALREHIRNHAQAFPDTYGYSLKVQLDRYDFQSKLFRLADRTPIRGVNAFRLFKTQGDDCGLVKIRHLPTVFRAVLATPVYIPGLPLTPAESSALLARMKASGNDRRVVTARFNLRVVYIEPLEESGFTSLKDVPGPTQRGHAQGEALQMDTRLDSVDFFEDDAMTKLIYSFKP